MNLLCPLSPIYRGKEGGGCHPARPGELGCFHQKATPSVGTPWKVHVGLIAICTPLFTIYTPFPFFAYSFSITLRNFTDYVTVLFSFRNVVKLYGLRNHPLFDFWNVTELYGLRNNASFRLPTCRGTSRIP